MIKIWINIFFTFIFFLYQNSVYSKTNDIKEFNYRYLSNYFSALLAFDNQDNNKALKYFNSSKSLLSKHDKYLKGYIFSLVEDGQVAKAIKEIKYWQNENNSNFFEAQILLLIDSILKKDEKKSEIIFSNLNLFIEDSTYEQIIIKTLRSYFELFKNKKIYSADTSFGKLSLITNTFQNCYLDTKKTNSLFLNISKSQDGGYSRYLFFYLLKIIEDRDYNKAENIASTIDPLTSGLLISQSKRWIDKGEFVKFDKFFSCKEETDLLGEFFFLIANLYASEEDYFHSNFFLNISNYLNSKFYFNNSLKVENYYLAKNYNASKKELKKFNYKDDIYYWFRIKKNTQIIASQKNEIESLKFIENKFNLIKEPSLKIIYDMANNYKRFKKYKKAIDLYTLVIEHIDQKSEIYADILYRRGGSYERIGKYEKSDHDLLESLEVLPNDPYVMNYLAYSWLERNYKIEEALNMLEIAYQQKKNDPYIIDSVGWAYYLIKDYEKAEEYLIQAVQIMPEDPIVNDHYGDILWKLNKKIQARYFWKNVLELSETEDSMKKKIKEKLLRGIKKI